MKAGKELTIGIENPSTKQRPSKVSQCFALFVIFEVRRQYQLLGKGEMNTAPNLADPSKVTLMYCGSVVTICDHNQ